MAATTWNQWTQIQRDYGGVEEVLRKQYTLYRDTHIMLFKVPIMLCSYSQHQANYAHCFVPIMLLDFSQFLIF